MRRGGALAAESARDFLYRAPESTPFKNPFGVGPEQALLDGDPSKPGIYVLRVRFPPRAFEPAFRARDRYATVIKGVWRNFVDDDLDFRRARPVAAGSFVLHSAGGVHCDGAGPEEEAIV